MRNPFRKRWAVRDYYRGEAMPTQFRYWTRWGAQASADWMGRRLRPRSGFGLRVERLP